MGTRKVDIDGAACGGDTLCGQGSVRNRRGYGSHTAVTGPEQGGLWLGYGCGILPVTFLQNGFPG